MNSSGDWTLRIRKKALKTLLGFPRKDKERVLSVTEELPLNPYVGDVEKMKGEENGWRRRVGAYRIFYEIIPEDRVVYVFRIERRTSKTY